MIIDVKILCRYFEGKASDSDVAMIRKWLEESPENKNTLEKERRMYDIMHLSGKPEPVLNKSSSKRHVIFRETLKITAVSAIVLLLSIFYHAKNKDTEEDQFQSITVPSGQRINITLPDGTSVWLNARTTIKYPLTFNKENRQVTLNGEAYFDVIEDKKKPFVVHTPKGRLEVLGTVFNVYDYSDNVQFETMLFEGSVKVNPNDSLQSAVMLIPGYKSYLENGKLEVTHVEDYSVYRWIEGLICFENEAFSMIMNDFEKYYGLKIVVENEKAKKQYYSGKFRQTDGIDYALRVLQKDIHFKYSRDDENSIIYIR